MLIGIVKGNVVSSNKTDKLTGTKMLIVQPVDLSTMKEKNDYVVCVDDIGAGTGELVFCAYGSSARQTDTSKEYASDYSIYGIIDRIDIKNVCIYHKSNGQGEN
jgi:ethanolamine utilization protein EutN